MAYSLCEIDPHKGYSLQEGPIKVGEEVYENLLHYFVINKRYPQDYEVVKELESGVKSAYGNFREAS